MFVLALSPILWLVLALSVIKMAAWKACLVALIISLAAGMGVWDMESVRAIEAVLEGVALACWPILLVIVAAIFTYNLTLHTKAMDTIKDMLTSVSHDKRVLILLIGWGFGGFLEGMAGFGTAIAVPAGMLAGIGINPILSVSVCLIANSVPTAYGSIGIPLVTLGSVTGFDAVQLATFTSLQLGVLTLLCPWLMVIVTGGGLKGLRGMTMFCLGAGLAFFIPELALSMFVGPELAVVAGAICTMGTIVFIAKKFPVKDPEFAMSDQAHAKITTAQGINACLPFILIFIKSSVHSIWHYFCVHKNFCLLPILNYIKIKNPPAIFLTGGIKFFTLIFIRRHHRLHLVFQLYTQSPSILAPLLTLKLCSSLIRPLSLQPSVQTSNPKLTGSFRVQSLMPT